MQGKAWLIRPTIDSSSNFGRQPFVEPLGCERSDMDCIQGKWRFPMTDRLFVPKFYGWGRRASYVSASLEKHRTVQLLAIGLRLGPHFKRNKY
jgi:hypothetical protein